MNVPHSKRSPVAWRELGLDTAMSAQNGHLGPPLQYNEPIPQQSPPTPRLKYTFRIPPETGNMNDMYDVNDVEDVDDMEDVDEVDYVDDMDDMDDMDDLEDLDDLDDMDDMGDMDDMDNRENIEVLMVNGHTTHSSIL